MAITVGRIGNSFAAEVLGLDLANGASPDEITQIKRAIDEFPVLCLRAQPINDHQQTAFASHLGPLLVNEFEELGGRPDGTEKLLFVATVDSEGKPIAKDSLVGKMGEANRLWHSDGTHRQPPVHYTTLSARILPERPPPTEYVDLRNAWDRLSPERQAQFEGSMVVHSVLESRRKSGMNQSEFTEEFLKKSGSVTQPLVRVNPRNGRRSLYLASHASHILGMPIEQGRAILAELTALATTPENIYAHQWEPNDLMIWDNFCLMHRATEYHGTDPRYLRWSGSLQESGNQLA